MSIEIDYFSDVLCVWAWIAERRQDELRAQFGDDVVLQQRFVDVFGDTAVKIGLGWESRGGFEGFGRHVVESASPYADAPVVDSIWRDVRPASSTPAHIAVKAAEISHSPAAAVDLARRIREAFFTESLDIGHRDVLVGLAAGAGLDTNAMRAAIDDGKAVAAVLRDYRAAQAQGIKGSPSWVLDGGRQILYGNVGFRVLRANAGELLKEPGHEASWC